MKSLIPMCIKSKETDRNKVRKYENERNKTKTRDPIKIKRRDIRNNMKEDIRWPSDPGKDSTKKIKVVKIN